MVPAKLLTITFRHNNYEERSSIVDFFSLYLLTHTNKLKTLTKNNSFKIHNSNVEISNNINIIGNQTLLTYQITWANVNDNDEIILNYILSIFTKRTYFSKGIFKSLKLDFESSFASLINNYAYASAYYLSKAVLPKIIISNNFLNKTLLNDFQFSHIIKYYNEIFKSSEVHIGANFKNEHLISFESEMKKFFDGNDHSYIDSLEYPIYKKASYKIKSSPLVISLVYNTNIRFPNLNYLMCLLLNELLGGNQASYLFSEIREKKSLAYQVDSSYDRFTGLITVYVITDNDDNINQIRTLVNNFFSNDYVISNFDKMKAFLIENIKLDADYPYEYYKEKLLFQNFGLIYKLEDKLSILNNVTLEEINQLKLSSKLIYEQIVSQ